MKKILLISFVILLGLPLASVAQEGVATKAVNKAFNPPEKIKKKKKKKKQNVPVKINLGMGLSQYKLFDVYPKVNGQEDRVPSIFGTEFTLSGVVEQKTIRRFLHKVPPKYRKVVGSLKEVSASHMLIPKTFYIQPLNSSGVEAYGITWSLLGLQMGAALGPVSFFLGGGAIFTYLHYRDFAYEDPVHFIRPGLRGTAGLRLHMFKNNFVVEVGGRGDIYIPQEFYDDVDEKSLWNMRAVYIQVHVRYPITVKASI